MKRTVRTIAYVIAFLPLSIWEFLAWSWTQRPGVTRRYWAWYETLTPDEKKAEDKERARWDAHCMTMIGCWPTYPSVSATSDSLNQ